MRPGPLLLPALALGLALGLAEIAWPLAGVLWVWWALGLGAALGLDLVLLWLVPDPEVQRTLPAALALGVAFPVEVRVENKGRLPLRVTLFDGCPPEHEMSANPQSARLPGRGHAVFTWKIRPVRRGLCRFAPAELVLQGPLGLLARRRVLGAAEEVKVYPDFQRVAEYAMLTLQNRVAQMGIHRRRRRGEGLEFFQLRDFREGDSLRQVDWKAVSRRCTLISRDYQDEQNQSVVFLLDCGRRMHAHDGDLTHFDHVLNATLLLGHVALRQGDAVGLMTFGGPDRWISPLRGTAALPLLLNRVYDLQTTVAPPDYGEAATRLLQRQRRRSLVVVLTNLRDEDDAELAPALALLKRRHLVLLANLRETILDEIVAKPAQDLGDALRTAAAWEALEARRLASDALPLKGLLSLDVRPSQLPVALVNRYLDIKAAGVL